MLPTFLTVIYSPPTPSHGCRHPLPPNLLSGGPSLNFTLNSPRGGGDRRYLLHLPSHFSASNKRPVPMVIVIHAFGQTTASVEEMTGFSEEGEGEGETDVGVVVVYPEGVNNVWLGDPGAHNLTTLDDRPFISDLLTHLTSTLCLDTSCIYATGFSNGGGLAALLACYPPTASRIAAFAGVSAAYYTKQSLGYSLFEPEACDTGGRKTMPFLDVHGEKDMVIAYDGDNSNFDVDGNGVPDPDTLPINSWLNDWGTVVLRDGGDGIVRGSWTCRGWEDVVVGYRVRGLGHGWPSTVKLDEVWEGFRLGPQGWNASRVLMKWFWRWSLGSLTSEGP
ncbi:alpha/beta-hydrolase [Westerdykella ornata]|uniref:feruloyl esterase n=1 Tax=Westerdykella ornata TaxID=318751 RepID=A0A6A6JCZ7_WESOR|nr:alpha/beta-hydrolase [Westerdykella ornata]KAF2274302.1 alpha/beta-hydrolase [Westerdykella ornata]